MAKFAQILIDIIEINGLGGKDKRTFAWILWNREKRDHPYHRGEIHNNILYTGQQYDQSIGEHIMNILKKLANTVSEKITVKTLLGEETYCFYWNPPAMIEDIEDFELRNQCSLPNDYKEFLLTSNGAIIFRSEDENEDDGYKLLSVEEMEKVTQELEDDGYDISDKCYCFTQCLWSDDVLLFDLRKKTNYIIDGDVGYPSMEWEYIKSDVNKFFVRLCQCNGAMYWRW